MKIKLKFQKSVSVIQEIDEDESSDSEEELEESNEQPSESMVSIKDESLRVEEEKEEQIDTRVKKQDQSSFIEIIGSDEEKEVEKGKEEMKVEGTG